MTLEEALTYDKIREVEAALDGKEFLRRNLKPPLAVRPYYEGHQTVGGSCIVTDGKVYKVCVFGSWQEIKPMPLPEYHRVQGKDDWAPLANSYEVFRK